MPELSILMKLKDEITTRIKAIMDLFKEFISQGEELAKAREELSEKERIIEEIMAEEREAILEAEENEAIREMELMEEVYGKKQELTDLERALEEIKAEEREAIIEAEENEAIREMELMEKVYGKREDVTEKERKLMEFLAQLRKDLAEEEELIWQHEQEEMEKHYGTQESLTKDHLSELSKQHDDFYTKIADFIDDSIKKEETLIDTLGDHKEATEELTDVLPDFSRELSRVSLDLSSVSSMAAAAAAEVRQLRKEIAALKSKTIVITIIRRYKTERSGGSSGGSNPFTVSPGVPTTAEDKDFTERRILPALKTLSREGKVGKEVVLT